MTAIYNRTGSLLICALLHASANAQTAFVGVLMPELKGAFLWQLAGLIVAAGAAAWGGLKMGIDPDPEVHVSREVPELRPGVRLSRHESLVPLSRDHHDVLVHAQELRRSAESGDVDRLSAATLSYLRYFRGELSGHFADEEGVLLPAVSPLVEVVARIGEEHAEIRKLTVQMAEAARAGRASAELARELAQLLHDHVRYEERMAFMEIQKSLDEGQLAKLGESIERHRQERGVAPGCPLPTRISER